MKSNNTPTDLESLVDSIAIDIAKLEAIQELCNHVPAFMLETDLDNDTFLWGNRELNNYLGFDVAGVRISWWMDNIVLPGEQQQATKIHYYEQYKGTLNPDSVMQITNVLKRHDGIYHVVRWYSTPHTSAAGARRGYSAGILGEKWTK